MTRLIPNLAKKQDVIDLESAIYRIGRELTDRSAGLAPTLFNRRWWANPLLDWWDDGPRCGADAVATVEERTSVFH